LEMYPVTRQEVLTKWSLGILTEAQFIREGLWYTTWNQNYAFYKPIFDIIKAGGIPLYALNAPREIISKPGDTFTVLEQWIDLDQNGSPSTTATQQGATLTFGDQPFRWKDLDAAAGDYVVGFVVEDLDGNPQQVFEHITVR